MIRPSGARLSSVGRILASQTLSAASKTGVRRFEAVSSGPTILKSVGFFSMMSRRKTPATLVASLMVVPGFLTGTP